MTTESYFEQMVAALTGYLRSYRGQLDRRWLGIDADRRSMLVRRSQDGISAHIGGEWLGAPVVTKWGRAAGRELQCEFPRVSKSRRDLSHQAVSMKALAGSPRIAVEPGPPWGFRIALVGTHSTVILVGPELVFGNARGLVAASRKPGFSGAPPSYEIPSFSIGIISNRSPSTELEGFDADPVVMAVGLADTILRYDQVRRFDRERYKEAAERLRKIVSTMSPQNESLLQELISERPWILVDEPDYSEVLSRPRFNITERMSNGDDSSRVIVPDFVYHLHGEQSLVVEIESATKTLQTIGVQAGYRIPSAKTSHASYQIAGYKQTFDGSLGSQIKAQLGLPDSWSFRYLLVVGSASQPGFDSRSWQAFHDHSHRSGVEVRTWDHYIARLERIAHVSRFPTSST